MEFESVRLDMLELFFENNILRFIEFCCFVSEFLEGCYGFVLIDPVADCLG